MSADDIVITQGNTDEKDIQVVNGRVNGKFAKGISGNPAGRPKGARNVLSKSVLGTYAKEAANGDFERVMAELKRNNPAVYAKLLNDAAMKEAERTTQAAGGLCEACGGELESKTVLSVNFKAPPARDSEHNQLDKSSALDTDEHTSDHLSTLDSDEEV